MQKIKELEMNFLMGKQQFDNQKVKSLLKDETKKIEDINSLVKNETSKQHNDIMQRLTDRKNKKIQKEKMIDNITNVVSKKRDSVVVQGRRISRCLDTNVLQSEYSGKEENKSPDYSPNSSEMRNKSIAMLKRASKDLTAMVEKRMSKLNLLEIEKAVKLNRENSIKKHSFIFLNEFFKLFFKKVNQIQSVAEEKKKDDDDDNESSESEDMSKTFTETSDLQSPSNTNYDINSNNLIKLKSVKGKASVQNKPYENKVKSIDEIKNKTSVEAELINNNLKTQSNDNSKLENSDEIPLVLQEEKKPESNEILTKSIKSLNI